MTLPGPEWPRCVCGYPCTPEWTVPSWECGNDACRGYGQTCYQMTAEQQVALVHVFDHLATKPDTTGD